MQLVVCTTFEYIYVCAYLSTLLVLPHTYRHAYRYTLPLHITVTNYRYALPLHITVTYYRYTYRYKYSGMKSPCGFETHLLFQTPFRGELCIDTYACTFAYMQNYVVALMMGTHSRLGADSRLLLLDPYMAACIAQMFIADRWLVPCIMVCTSLVSPPSSICICLHTSIQHD